MSNGTMRNALARTGQIFDEGVTDARILVGKIWRHREFSCGQQLKQRVTVCQQQRHYKSTVYVVHESSSKVVLERWTLTEREGDCLLWGEA